jgi:hypothetical protein
MTTDLNDKEKKENESGKQQRKMPTGASDTDFRQR